MMNSFRPTDTYWQAPTDNKYQEVYDYYCDEEKAIFGFLAYKVCTITSKTVSPAKADFRMDFYSYGKLSK